MKNSVIFLFMFMMSCPCSGYNSDHVSLDAIMSELDVIKKIIYQARANQQADSRYFFKWEYLLNDVTIISDGISDWNNRELIEPRAVEVLKGDYLGVVVE